MFAIEDEEWPGISKLAEEAGEVLQVIGKLLGTGGIVDHWDGSNLKNRLEEEIADVVAAARFVVSHCNLNNERIEKRLIEKLYRFNQWHALGDTNKKALR